MLNVFKPNIFTLHYTSEMYNFFVTINQQLNTSENKISPLKYIFLFS